METPLRPPARPAAILPSRWERFRTPPASGAWNMAMDMAMLDRSAHMGHGQWRCYAWSRPTVSFGRNETVADRFDAASCEAAGFDTVRRPTGGRALLHAREVTYSATFPLPAHARWQDAYAIVNAILLRALRSIGVRAELAPAAKNGAIRPNGPLCFEAPSAGELVLGGAKLAGSAVWRERGAYLQHGSILLHDDQAGLASARIASRRTATIGDPKTRIATRAIAGEAVNAVSHVGPNAVPPAASLAATFAAAGRAEPTWELIATALERSLEETLKQTVGAQAAVTLLPLDAALVEATERHVPHFISPDWLWRR